MPRNSKRRFPAVFLGIEGGSTRTVALLANEAGRLIRRFETGPANLRLIDDLALVDLLRSIADAMPLPNALAVGLAGARSAADRKRIRKAARQVWPSVPCYATNDLETGLAAAQPNDALFAKTRVLVLSGTGSCCFGRNTAHRTAKAGGWGHVLGDAGSGFRIGLDGLRAVASFYDHHGAWPGLGRRLLKRLNLKRSDELIEWAQAASKPQIAGLAPEVFAAARAGDRLARDVTFAAAESLSEQAATCARQLGSRDATVEFVLSGGNLLKQPMFRNSVIARLGRLQPRAIISLSKREGAWGAVALAQEEWRSSGSPFRHANRIVAGAATPRMPLVSTEQRNPRSLNLHKLSLPDAIGLMLSEDSKIPAAVLRERLTIARAIRWMTSSFKQGGRLFYVGAGTSGRLGVLDASECPPTFRTPPSMVQGIIAGGQRALWRSVEGAEDDSADGARAIKSRKVTRRDVVVGIAASGRTPFVWGALNEAKRRGARTILLTFNPCLGIPRRSRPTLVIAPEVGPEVLTGSTRLKAGTATKLILNLFTTLAMVRLGKVMGNLMVDLNPTNAKLRDRAVRIVQELCRVDYPTAQKALADSRWSVRSACASLNRKSVAAR